MKKSKTLLLSYEPKIKHAMTARKEEFSKQKFMFMGCNLVKSKYD